MLMTMMLVENHFKPLRPVMDPHDLEELLRQAGFSHIRQYGELKFRAPKPGEGRIFFAARKEF